ncbi:MAG: DNA recombination protein RmuC [Campylobacteraceae bacterium]|nr:DNA recombination protein RmuC [Campylobacteraceae bacterium]
MNEILILVALVVSVVIILLVFLLFKQREFFYTQMLSLQKFINEQNIQSQSSMSDINDSLIDRFFMLNKNLNDIMANSNRQATNTLNSNFSSLDERFKNILEKVSELENAKESTNLLKDEVMKLNRVFSNQKLRGNYGEFELNRVLSLTYGENKSFYETQKRLPNGKIVDVALNLKENLIVAVDSKFPLTSYEKVCNTNGDKTLLERANKEFVRDIKTHINDISSKYILPPYTTRYAILFIPSEAIFTYICSNLSEVFSYMSEKSVFLASPSTLMALLNSLNLFIKDEKISKEIESIKSEIFELSKEFEVFKKQSLAVLNYADKLSNASKTLYDNSKIISNRFDKINNLDFN